MGNAVQWVVFVLTSLVAVGASLMVITRRNPIHSAMFLVLNFFCIAVLYLLLNSQFIAVLQIMIYAGAIMMLVVFVIMLLNVEEEAKIRWLKLSPGRLAAVILVVVLCGILLLGLWLKVLPGQWGDVTPERLAEAGEIRTVAGLLFTRYLFPFEVASVLLLVGIIGAVILSKKER